MQAFWRKRKHRPQALGGELADGPLSLLADPASALSRQWDEEHDRHVVRRLLEMLEADSAFEPITLRAFHRVVFDAMKPALVAAELNLSVNSVLLAKSRVLKWLRQEAAGLID